MQRTQKSVGLFWRILVSVLMLLAMITIVDRQCVFPFNLLAWALNTLDFVFHEIGHMVFGLLGFRFLGALGGTLGQLIVPAVFMALALYRRQTLSFWPFLFWFGSNFLEIGPYISDARAQALPLVSPILAVDGNKAIHDWHYMLGQLGLLAVDQYLGWAVYALGFSIMLVAIVGPILQYFPAKAVFGSQKQAF